MDKFVTRKPTWQTLTYTSTLQKSQKDLQQQPKKNFIVASRKPLRESQIQIQQTIGVGSINSPQHNKRRLSIRDEQLLRIFASKPDQPLIPTAAPVSTINEDSGLSSSSHGSLDNFNDPQVDAGSQPLAAAKEDNMFELSDYVIRADTQTCSSQQLFNSQTPPSVNLRSGMLIEEENTPINANDKYQKPQENHNNNNDRPITPLNQQVQQMARIQRDINSPSAAVRVRAIRALKNPTSAAYTNFDVPHEEQDIISAEERHPPPPPSIEDLMRDIIVYVEVRTGEDNRSEGVKKVISQLGARVNDKLLKGTTHVIFKDGLLSTYKKAKNWNIPVVSILWVEACKNKRMICDPKEFPISNIDRYENPELYEKMKRHKSMQPDSECNKRIRLKQGTTKDSTPKTATDALTKTPSSSSVLDNTPKSSRKQTDISQFFRKLTNANSTPIINDNRNELPPSSITTIRKDVVTAESPATQFLKRIESNTFTPIKAKRPVGESNSTALTISNTKQKLRSPKKPLYPLSTPSKRADKKKLLSMLATPTPKKHLPQGRTSVQMPVAAEMAVPIAPLTPGPMTRRRSSIHTAMNMSLSTLVTAATPVLVSMQATATATTTFSAIPEENGYHEGEVNRASENGVKKHRSSCSPKSPKNGAISKKRIMRRRTTYTNKTLDVSPDDKTPNKPNKRRTLYTPSLPVAAESVTNATTSELSLTKINESPKVLDEDLLQFALTPTTTTAIGGKLQEGTVELPPPSSVKKDIIVEPGALLEEHSTAVVFSSTRLPSANRRRTLFDVSMDIIQQRLHNINNSAKRSVANELAFNDNTSPSILPTTKTKTTTATKNSALPAVKRANGAIDDESVKSLGIAPTTPITTTNSSPPKPIKKRKLFVPNDLTATPPLPLPPLTSSSAKKNSESNAKRRRTITTPRVIEKVGATKSRKSLAPTRQPPPVPPSSSTTTSSLGNVAKGAVQSLTTMLTNCYNNNVEEQETRKEGGDTIQQQQLFVQQKQQGNVIMVEVDENVENIAIKMPSTAAMGFTQKSETTTAARSSATSVKNTKTKAVKKSQMCAIQPPDAIKGAVASVAGAAAGTCSQMERATAAEGGNKNKWPYIVCTNMHREQIKVMREAIATLGGSQLSHFVDDETTHLITFEPRRTLNLLRALIRGLWILDYNWVLDSLKAGQWLSEEEYELRAFSRAVEICRTERQAFGKTYKCELFSALGTFYISSRCGPISKDNLKELIELCGGKVVDHRKRAKYILGDPHRTLEDKIYVTPFWVLDSITQMQVMRQQKYSYVMSSTPKSQQQQQQSKQQQQLPPTEAVVS